ncbi:MAG: B12-binding domain-containing radical SAM protein [Candidatus Hydrothermota bacterium]|nr:MAG: B12-binding domain-containing radical SAM protein [Candidatus Hydrothermae bacterium]
MKDVLLINPPVYDFAAYDFWMKPYGLLRIGRFLSGRFRVHLFDFMDRGHPSVEGLTKSTPYGTGKYASQIVEKPRALKPIKRRYKRYGIPRDVFLREAGKLKPEFVFISSGMTYWYPGIREVLDSARKLFPRAKVVIGGVYASLMPDDVYQRFDPDLVIVSDRIELLRELMEIPEPPAFSPPLWEAYRKLRYGVIKLQDGCPFRCPYCASWVLSPRLKMRNLKEILDEIDYLCELGVRDIAFYDDALLLTAKKFFPPIMEHIKRKGYRIRFHTPNALHARFLDRETAELMKAMGFKTVYLGLETVNQERQLRTGGKVTNEELESAVENLLEAGFSRCDITVYLMMGLPGQEPDEVEEGIRYVHSLGVKVMLSEYSPIPRTPCFEEASRIHPLEDPLLHNPSVFPVLYYGEEKVNRLKDLKNRLNRKLKAAFS